jgi:hypothetical protein
MTGLNDASLYTGLSSPARLKTIKAKEDDAKTTSDPRADIVLDELAKEKTRLMSIESIVLTDMSDEERLKQLQRNRDQYDYLTTLEHKLRKILGMEKS